jgi:hypothetical protein
MFLHEILIIANQIPAHYWTAGFTLKFEGFGAKWKFSIGIEIYGSSPMPGSNGNTNK